MKHFFFALALVLIGTAVCAQPGPGPVPSPWVVNGSATYKATGQVGIGTATPNSGNALSVAPTGSAAAINIAPTSTPASPNNGDIWDTTTGFYGRVNGATVGPFASASAFTPVVNVAAMKSISSPSNGMLVFTKGYSSVGIGSAFYYFNSSDATTPNLCNHIPPNSGSGEWDIILPPNGPINVDQCGADPTSSSDSTNAFQAAATNYYSINMSAGGYNVCNVNLGVGAMTFSGSGVHSTTVFIPATCSTRAFYYGDLTHATFCNQHLTVRDFMISSISSGGTPYSRGPNDVSGIVLAGSCLHSAYNVWGNAINGALWYLDEGDWDGHFYNTDCEACGATDGSLAPIMQLASTGNLGINHEYWIGGHIEGTYGCSDAIDNGGNNGEGGNSWTDFKWGLPNYVFAGPASNYNDLCSYHIQILEQKDDSLTGLNWFFGNGAVAIRGNSGNNSGGTKLIGISGTFLSNCIWVDATSTSGPQGTLFSDNICQGNGDTGSAITGSLTTNHYGIYSDIANGLIVANQMGQFTANMVDGPHASGNGYSANSLAGQFMTTTNNTFLAQPVPGQGGVGVTTVSGLPSCGASQTGYTYTVSDSNTATFGATITGGGGSNLVVALCNGLGGYTVH